MPARQPFTHLCRLLARGPHQGRADLHAHSTASDGAYTPAQVVELARRGGLGAVALTDHDTTAGLAEARAAAAGAVELVAGVEITAEHAGREVHILGYFIDPDDRALGEALAAVRAERAERFAAMVARLRACGVTLGEEALAPASAADSLGRRHLAEALVRSGAAATVREAFARWLRDGGRAAVPKRRLPVAEALALVRGAGGVASWAHPGADCGPASLAELRGLGLGAVEAEYPDVRGARQRELRGWAAALGLAVSGGSDCHGPGRRCLGCRSVTAAELEALRRRAANPPLSPASGERGRG
jgi:predicted metal-dependent phosphoesterase TrpH